VPVADDYTFLATLAFQHPLDWLGSMGSPLYWRPVSRQLYYLVLGPALVAHPLVAPLVHAALLAALFAVLYRIARHAWAPPVAATLAALPLAAEPVRVLLGWPSGGEYLLAALFAALAVHQALRGRLLTSTLAALLAVLSHEAGLLVLPVLPLVAWRRLRSPRHAMPWLGAVAAVGALWAAGFAASRAHGAALPPATGGPLLAAWWDVFGRTLRAQLLGEDATPWVRVAIASAALVWTVAMILEWRRANRSQPFRRGLVFGGLVWFVLGLVPAARVLPDWNAWRTFYPSLGLAFTVVGLAAAVAPRCVPLMLVVKLLSVALAPPAPRARRGAAAADAVRAVVRAARALAAHRRIDAPRAARAPSRAAARRARALLDDSRAHRVRLRGPARAARVVPRFDAVMADVRRRPVARRGARRARRVRRAQGVAGDGHRARGHAAVRGRVVRGGGRALDRGRLAVRRGDGGAAAGVRTVSTRRWPTSARCSPSARVRWSERTR
jgi:hypothetical protein